MGKVGLRGSNQKGFQIELTKCYTKKGLSQKDGLFCLDGLKKKRKPKHSSFIASRYLACVR